MGKISKFTSKNRIYMKRAFIKLIFLAAMMLPTGAMAQVADSLINVCYKDLEGEDTTAFNLTYPLLYDAYVKENDEMYPVIQMLKKVHDRDQSIRILLSDIYKNMDAKGKYLSRVRQIMKNIDQENVKIVTGIIDEYGWLGKDDIGEEANETLFLCIQHCQDSLLQHKYLPIIKEAVSNGNAEAWHFAFLTDRVRMNGGQPQIYGTQTINVDDKTYLVPLQNPNNVDSLRREVGLEPLNDYMQGFGESFSVEEYLKAESVIKQRFEQWLHSHEK